MLAVLRRKPAEFEGNEYLLKKLLFHQPSETKVDGVQFPLELQMLHDSSDGRQLALSVLFEQGSHSSFLESIGWDRLPSNKGMSIALGGFHVGSIVRAEDGYFQYDGSLTQPPCTEGVKWVVLTHHPTLSSQQVPACCFYIHPSRCVLFFCLHYYWRD